MKTLFNAARPILQDMLSSILFAALFALSGNMLLATLAAVGLGAGQVARERMRGETVPAMQWASLGLVVVLGGVALLTGDPRFVMIKPTVIYLTIGAAMLQRGWLARYIPPASRDRVPEGAVIGWGYAWAALMLATAAANLAIVLTLGRSAWALFISVVPLASKLALFAATYLGFRLAARARTSGALGTALD